MASKLFKEPMISEKLGDKGAYVTLTMYTNKACSHVKLLYVTVKFNRQPEYQLKMEPYSKSC